jgi:hypothetical protein
MEAVQTQTAYPKGLDFEQVWAALKETDRIVKENAEQLNRQMKENAEQLKLQMKETDRRMKETDRQMKETDRQMKETDRRLGKLSNRFGEIVEHMVAPNLREKFKELGLTFPKVNLNSDVRDYENNIFLEADVMLENGEKALLAEVKTTLTTEDVKDHIKRLEKMRTYANLHGDKRAFLGAVAGVVMTPIVKEYALGQGLYVIEPSGETFNITPPHGNPKEW